MPSWTLSIDRRRADRSQMIDELRALEATVQDLQVELVSDRDFEAADDGGAFRDFVALAILTHPHREGLEYVAEDLLERFGWLVDFRRPREDDN